MQFDPADIMTTGGPLAAFYAVIETTKHLLYKKAKNGGGFAADDKARLAEIQMIVEDMKTDDKDANRRGIQQELLISQMSDNIKVQTGIMMDLPRQLAQAIRESK